MIALGVDPGTLVSGFGIVLRHGSTYRLLGCGTVINAARLPLAERLATIYRELTGTITEHKPDEFAIETAFYGKNAQSALKLGHARGVCILAAIQHGLPIAEYSPREVKKAVVGNGNASKEQVQYMVKTLLGIRNGHMLHDTSDALAIAICHLQRMSSPTHRHRDWGAFVKAHPERVRS